MDDSTTDMSTSSPADTSGTLCGCFYLDVVQDELVPLLGRGHLAVSDGLSQCLLGNEGVQVQHGGQAAVEADEFVLVGAEVD